MLVDSSHFGDRDRVANGRGAVCDGAKLLYKSLKMKERYCLLFEPRKIFVRFSDIRLFANIRTIRFNPSLGHAKVSEPTAKDLDDGGRICRASEVGETRPSRQTISVGQVRQTGSMIFLASMSSSWPLSRSR